jgi:hypothetical protein
LDGRANSDLAGLRDLAAQSVCAARQGVESRACDDFQRLPAASVSGIRS